MNESLSKAISVVDELCRTHGTQFVLCIIEEDADNKSQLISSRINVRSDHIMLDALHTLTNCWAAANHKETPSKVGEAPVE